MRGSNVRRVGSVVAALATVAQLLIGCAVPGPAPIPTPVVVEPPESVLSLDCASSISSASLGTLFDASVVLRRDEDAAPAEARDVVNREAGATECVWGGEVRLGTHYETGLGFVVLPDAEEAFLAHVLPVIDTQYTIVDTVGDRSQYACAYGQCSFDVLVADAWVGGYVDVSGGADETLEQLLLPVLTEVTAAVREAADDAAQPWTVPDGVVGSWGECLDDSEIVVGLREVFDKPDLYPVGGEYSPIDFAASERIGASPCAVWADDLTLVVDATLVPGGAWALDGMVVDPPEDPYLGAFSPATVEEAGDAIIACAEGVGCAAFLAIGGSLVEVRAQPAEYDSFVSDLGEIVQLVAEAI